MRHLIRNPSPRPFSPPRCRRPAAAQAFPNKPVTIVVPYAAGGSTDVLARVLAEAMTRDLGQQVIVENLGGAGGTIGASRVTRPGRRPHLAAAQHGHRHGTRALQQARFRCEARPGTHRAGRRRAHDPGAQQRLCARHAGGLHRPHEGQTGRSALLACRRERHLHLCAMLLLQTTSTEATLVPYRGTGPALQDLVAGNVDVICDQPVATGPHIQAGMLKGYAVATRERLPSLPDVPTFAQAGQPGFELAVWHGLYAPRRTPQAVIERLNKSLRTALSEPALVKRFTDMSVIIPSADTSRRPAPAPTAEIKRWDPVIKAAGARSGIEAQQGAGRPGR
ncbi:Myosin light chain kinase, smooth muscle [Manis javanica]|nr:Myosin light chain kinase, smooth muscle [Manis javanica]